MMNEELGMNEKSPDRCDNAQADPGSQFLIQNS